VVLWATADRGFAAEDGGPVVAVASVVTGDLQEDFPAMCLDQDGTPWVAYVAYDGKTDVLRIAKKSGESLEPIGQLAGPSVIHQPALACDGKGAIWAVWSQVDAANVMRLHARRVVDGKIDAETAAIGGTSGNAIFADAGTDRRGRVWVAWQSFRDAEADVFARVYDPQTDRWGDEIAVSAHAAGDWEPRLAFGADGNAAIVFDSSRDDNFDIFLANVTADGDVTSTRLTDSPHHQARPAIAATPDGRGYWIAYERGRMRWGKNARGGPQNGLNQQKDIDVIFVDAAGKITRTSEVRPLLAPLLPPKPAAAASARPARRQAAAVQAVNVPSLVVDADGNPWLACRYCNGVFWRLALMRCDVRTKRWSQPVTLPNSPFGQDRHCQTARGADGRLWFAWPSDLRTTKRALFSGVYLAEVDASAAMPAAEVPAKKAPAAKAATPVALFGDDTPERTRADRHTWAAGGKKYQLYFGDFHRHTDVSNCATPRDGCIVEQFRYAYDVAKLDFLGTSDHTDVGKPYDPYEWWCNQKLTDVFFAPGFFTSFYVYEREQRWPWGHRNVIFIERGGPLIYINRELYKSMPWHATLPVADGEKEILPQELWALLRKTGRDVSIISHTGATGMGTDWDGYEKIDHAVENLVEIYQGCRVSYEGIGTPQPTVGQPKTDNKGNPRPAIAPGKDFGQYSKGVYQNALRNGYKLGVFANSDHISTHVTFGGVYTESFTRQGILDALNARRTIAGTDKIFIEFSCNGHLLGEIFETADNPALRVSVSGTAPLSAVTILRNEVTIRRFTPKDDGPEFTTEFTDPSPLPGENRYYVRVEQTDGNMAWTSPVWVTLKRD